MAVTNEQLAVLDAELQSDLSSRRVRTTISRAEWRAAWLAVRDWLETNQASFNASLPAPARGSLTTPQKFQLLVAVGMQEYSNG